MSVKDRLKRKTYRDLWRWVSEQMTRTMNRYPVKVTKYIDRNSPKSMN